jgi:hypothetical protein
MSFVVAIACYYFLVREDLLKQHDDLVSLVFLGVQFF